MRILTPSVTLTRPSNTTPYAALDAISDSASAPTILTFSNAVSRKGGCGWITKARMLTNQSTFVAKLRLHLYTVAPAAINDNAAFTLLWANRASRIGSLTFPAGSTEGTGSDCASALVCPGGDAAWVMNFKAADDSQDIYGALLAVDGFTPASGQIFFIELTVEQ